MNLTDFLSTALQTGHARVVVKSTSRGYELHRGALADASASYLEALCSDDAQPLSRAALHDYVVAVESEDGSKSSRRTIRVHGGAGEQEEHRVDPLATSGAPAVVGHLVRLIVDQQKTFVQLAGKLIDKDMAETKELARLRRGEGRRGEILLTAKQLELDAEDRRAERERSAMLWSRLLALGEPLAARMLPGGKSTALASVRASLTEAQLTTLADLLGPVRFGKFLTLDTPEKVASLFCDEVTAELGQHIFAALNDQQRGLLSVACRAEMTRRTKAAEAAQAAADASNGAAS